MSSTATFHPNQKVFAKVRGYPPWPARILDSNNEVGAKLKFRVYFYGTKETAVCKSEELYDYLEYRDRYGKPLKRKGHAEAMQEIEFELEPSQRKNGTTILTEKTSIADPAAESTSASVGANATNDNGTTVNSSASTASVTAVTASGDKDSDDEYNLIIDENPTQKAKNNKTDITSSRPLKRKLSSGSVDMLTPPVTDHLPVEITSRSGRKIKPKKFLDEPSDVFNTPTQSKTVKSKNSRESVTIDENVKNKKLNDGSEIPVVVGTKAELRWDGSQNVKNLINLSENSGLHKNVKRDFKKTLKKKVEVNKQQQQQTPPSYQQQNQYQQPQGRQREFYLENENLELLKTEVQLLDADCRIKSSLSLASAECDECLHAMDEILDLKLNALMLKKHPEVVDTVRKLRKYVGNVTEWKLTAEQEQNFIEAAARIRAKADHIYNKIKILFAIPNGKSFFEVYSDEVLKFEKKTNNMSVNELYGLVKEPYE